MTTDHIITKLDQLAELQARYDVIALDRQAAQDAILTPDIREALLAIDGEYHELGRDIALQIAALETECKELVLAAGTSVKATYRHAVWNKPRVSWDTKGLDGYAVAHPEIGAFRKAGEPSVTIRRI